MKIIDKLLKIFYPNRCIACGKINHLRGFCKTCEGKVFKSRKGSCPKCGGRRGNCDCDTYSLSFDGFCAPYYYKGAVRQAVLNLKFYSRPDAAPFLAQKIAEKILDEYAGIPFDIICAVPMSEEGMRSRGYNQSELLCKEVAEILNIPISASTLVKIKNTKTQHTLDKKERFLNVKGAYSSLGGLEGKCVLLIDDIKTTGATLSECALVLKQGGASGVFCAAAANNTGR